MVSLLDCCLPYPAKIINITYDRLTTLTTPGKFHLDLIILEWMLLGLLGLEICHRLRSIGDRMPIILLTNHQK
ncbi:hypothetical protein [Nostoc sp. C117]|uniref:hypothetical protein n=1 Tax=Nostoc sp. C117 TaxID=3349875 RepID=UPI00370D9C6F